MLHKLKHTFYVHFCFPWIWCHLWDNAAKSGIAEQVKYRQYSTAHALCMLDNWGYRQTLKTCNMLYFRSNKVCTKAPQYYVCQYIACLVNVNVDGAYSNHWTLRLCYDTYDVNSRDIIQFILSRLGLRKSVSIVLGTFHFLRTTWFFQIWLYCYLEISASHADNLSC